ncbi:hypothetical protein V492_01164, partial [Pseudogymnoascus sp. VKM F-4246]
MSTTTKNRDNHVHSSPAVPITVVCQIFLRHLVDIQLPSMEHSRGGICRKAKRPEAPDKPGKSDKSDKAGRENPKSTASTASKPLGPFATYRNRRNKKGGGGARKWRRRGEWGEKRGRWEEKWSAAVVDGEKNGGHVPRPG